MAKWSYLASKTHLFGLSSFDSVFLSIISFPFLAETSRLKRAKQTNVQKHRQNTEALSSQDTNFLANLDTFHFNAHASEERIVRESCQALEPYFINNGQSMYTTSSLPHMVSTSTQLSSDSNLSIQYQFPVLPFVIVWQYRQIPLCYAYRESQTVKISGWQSFILLQSEF